ncbi:ABC-ATPase domain-containing protein [Actinomycetaceae bacterium MB13-C1-2]|nr:ABC-ATPase domain-containing protein [Actinomycetaceae bacterium MB13-C1-2]
MRDYGNNPRKQGGRGDRRRFDDTPKKGTDRDLLKLLHSIDGSSYGAYKQAVGEWDYGSFVLYIDRIQADPYAPPSSLRVVTWPDKMGLPEQTFTTGEQQTATADFLVRSLSKALRADKRFSSVSIVSVGQEILERSAASVGPKQVELRIQVSMPARGRTVLGHQAATIFDVELPDALGETFDFLSTHADGYRERLLEHVHTYEDYCALQRALTDNNWTSFIANEAILARKSGISQLPMEDSVPFRSPESLLRTVELPHAGTVRGMAIEPGITLIVGGGYHGKSTVLSAIQRGVYAHVPGDGRELVATLPAAMKIRAADGRPVTKVDVSPFINHLPTGSNTSRFSTQNASGSTSQAASIIEALGARSPLLLIDEDTSATNLMIRDERMRELVVSSQEPITPLIDRIRGLYESDSVSLILVMGGSGAYLDVADRVLQMDSYRCEDVTERAHKIAEENPRERTDIAGFPDLLPRCPTRIKTGGDRQKTKVSGTHSIGIDKQNIDVSDVEQVVEQGQTEAIAWAVRGILQALSDGEKTVADLTEEVEAILEKDGLDALVRFGARKYPAFLARPRAVDIAAALNRYRALEIA